MRDMQITASDDLIHDPAATASSSQTWLGDGVFAARSHWPEYLIEAACLGLFMLSACSFTVVLEHPSSSLRQLIPSSFLRRLLAGIAMGLTAIGLIYSPWGKRSGAHLNPSMTLTFLRLGKVKAWDAGFYVLAQFAGAAAGVMVSSIAWGMALAHMNVRYAATVPGAYGLKAAFAGEMVIAFLMMTVVLNVSNRAGIARFTGLFAGVLVATYITFEAPFSGMSMNAARTFGSALSASLWDGLWIYFTAPPLGMLLAAQLYLWTRGKHKVFCAKLHHDNYQRCIFRCNYKAISN
jgi:aquaporin Z